VVEAKVLSPVAKFSSLPPEKVDALLQIIYPPQDFALIPKQGFRGVEPTRDLVMKLIAFFGYSVNTEILEKATEEKSLGKMTQGAKKIIRHYTVKATVSDPTTGRFATGHGIANTDQSSINTPGREDHDAMTVAETRAVKRAVEAMAGLPIVNQLILHYYGGFTITAQKGKEINAKFEGKEEEE
jgi:hypothetical protein